MTRRGFTMIEVVVGLALFGLIVGVLVAFTNGGRRQERQVHAVAGVTERAARIEEALRRDLAQLPAGQSVIVTDEGRGLRMNRVERYEPGRDRRFSVRALQYSFEGSRLQRDGKTLVSQGLTVVRFRIASERARPRLLVELEGEGWPGRPAQTWVLRLPLPAARSEWLGE